MNYLKGRYLAPILVLGLFITIGTSCGSDDPEIVNPEEVITTVNISFTNNGQTDEVVTASWRDVDGPGGEDPIITGAVLNANGSYRVDVEFLNESASPAEDVTEEVREEDLDHQVFFIFGGNLGLSYAYGDQDPQGNPIGLTGTLNTATAGSGTLTLVLVHEPNKSSSGVADGDIGNAGGEEDVRVQIPITVQ